MSTKKYIDENGKYEFLFGDCVVWEYHELAKRATGLSDVDFIIETMDKVLFLEYKNAAIEGASKPEELFKKVKTEEFYKKIAKKYYDSLFLYWACKRNEQELPIIYTFLIEHPEIDGKIRKKLREKIYKQLPKDLAIDESIKRSVLHKFEVLNIDEWNRVYKEFNFKLCPC